MIKIIAINTAAAVFLLADTIASASELGVASQYSDLSLTASGKSFSKDDLVAAHRTLAFGTRVRVDSIANGRSVTVTIVDRGPFLEGRIIDLSSGAADRLGLSGLGQVRLTVIQ